MHPSIRSCVASRLGLTCVGSYVACVCLDFIWLANCRMSARVANAHPSQLTLKVYDGAQRNDYIMFYFCSLRVRYVRISYVCIGRGDDGVKSKLRLCLSDSVLSPVAASWPLRMDCRCHRSCNFRRRAPQLKRAHQPVHALLCRLPVTPFCRQHKA